MVVRRDTVECLVAVWLLLAGVPATAQGSDIRWSVQAPVLRPGEAGAFDETAVKDPSVVFFEGRWHVFYTARGQNEYTTGYVAADRLDTLQEAPRHALSRIKGRTRRYACAPQVFFFRPQGLWYLICQTRDSNYQPVYATTRTLDRPASWSAPKALVEKDEEAKWIDFWVICDATKAYLFYTRDHRDVYVRTTGIDAFPQGWSEGAAVFSGIHEAVHVYKVKGRNEYHMIYELKGGDARSFGLAVADQPAGPWTKVTDEYVVGAQLHYGLGEVRWTDMASHGEMIRTGYDERLEYDADDPAILIQGHLDSESGGPYPDLPWRLGLIRRDSRHREQIDVSDGKR